MLILISYSEMLGEHVPDYQCCGMSALLTRRDEHRDNDDLSSSGLYNVDTEEQHDYTTVHTV